MAKEVQPTEHELLADIKQMIDESRIAASQFVNARLTLLYWSVGKRINEEILGNERAEYGQQIVASLSRQLELEHGKGYSEKNLRSKIDSMLFERTAISNKPEELAKQELLALQEEDRLTPDLVFRDPYILDFLNLKDTYSEKDLEKAILLELERFILELGNGFTFVERQKRLVIDGEDFYLDLLFYHRRLKRLIAVELKIGKFKAAYKGQMELYLRWLEKHDRQSDEDPPVGLILCAEGNREQIELLQLDAANIKVAEYITQYLPPDLLKQKLHQFTKSSKQLLEHRHDKKH